MRALRRAIALSVVALLGAVSLVVGETAPPAHAWTSQTTIDAPAGWGEGTGEYGKTMSPDGSKMFVGTFLGVVVYDLSSESRLTTFSAAAKITGFQWNADGTRLYGTNGSNLVVFDTSTATPTLLNNITLTNTGYSSKYGMKLTPDGSALYIASYAGLVKILTSTLTQSLVLASSNQWQSLTINPAGTTAYIGSSTTNYLYPVTLSTGTLGTSIATSMVSSANVVSPDGNEAYLWSSGGNSIGFQVLNLTTGELGSLITTTGTYVRDVAVSGDGSTVAAVGTNASGAIGTDGKIFTYDSSTMEQTGTSAQGAGLFAVALNYDGTRAFYVLNTGTTTPGKYNEYVVPLKGSFNSNDAGGNNTVGVAMSPDGLKLYAINAGATTSSTSSLTIAGAAYASPQYQSQEISLGNAITPTSPLTANGLTGTITWAASSLPAGLSINSATGVVSGTPTAVRAGGYFNITGTASPSGLSVVAFVELRVTSISPATRTTTAFVGTKFSTPALSASGLSGTVTYSVSPDLPVGVAEKFNSTTGAITDADPRVPLESPTTYTITATGSSGGSVTSALVLGIASVTPVNTQVVAATVGTAIEPTSAFVSQYISGTPTWSAGSALPSGLSLDSSTGVISGTPTVASSSRTLITLTGTYPSGASVTRSVNIGVGQTGKSLSKPSRILATIGSAITSTTITTSGFSSTPTFSSFSPTLAGLNWANPITGTPTQPTTMSEALLTEVLVKAAYSTTEYAYGAVPFRMRSAGKTLTMPSSITAFESQPMSPTAAPTHVGLTGPIGYWVTPSLPTGLTLNTLTGEISGTPQGLSASKTYVVTAIGSASTLDIASTTFTLAVAGSLTPATQTVNASQGVAISETSTFTYSGISGTPTYSISPALPSGLQMSSTTGVISGTPTASQPATTYTITASGSVSGSAAASVTISVAGVSPATQTIRAVKGTAITPSTAFTETGFVGAVSYSLAGTLPTGLSFNQSTGVISGTPSTSQSLTTYTVTAQGATAGIASAQISISVAELPPATTSVQGTVGSAITNTVAFTPVGMTAPITYSVSPSLPSGLTMNTSTGVISGTPTVAQNSATYTITATDTNSVAASTTIAIQIAGLTPATQTRSTQIGSAITPTTALTATGFTGTVVYSVSPSVASAGLSFNSATGVISGIPTTALAQQIYTITGNGSAGTATSTVTITAATITPATQTLVLTAGTAGPSTAFSHFGFTGTMSYSISPAVPTGMNFSQSTGVLSGTPTTAQAATTYTVTATGSTAGSATATISLQVLLDVTPGTQRVLGNVGETLSTQALSAGGVSTSAIYTVSPSLPAGLSFNQNTGVISGTPTVGIAATTFTITATGSVVTGQVGTATVTLGINTSSVTLTPVRQSVVGTVSTALSTSSLSAAGFVGTVTYSVSPTLPNGLSMSSSTGVISGTPTGAQGSATYVISASGATSGAATAMVEIAVNSASAQISPENLTIIAVENLAISATQSLSTTGLNGAVTYSVSPTLPTGLTLNSSTGVITGTPTLAQAASPYVVTARGATSGVASSTVTIGVASANASASRPSQVIQAEAGQPITESASIDASGLVGDVTYSITPQLPPGLNFDPSTGIISGTPLTPLNGETFTITATGETSGVVSGIVTLSVASAGAEITTTPSTVISQEGQAITSTAALDVSGMTAPVSFSISPQLPAGLTLDPSTGIISGTPSAGSPATEYVITASGAQGEVASTALIIATSSLGASASPASQQQIGVEGLAITPTTSITPTGLTGTPTYTVTPALPDGLSIDPATGIISGIPTEGFVATSFVITGTGSGGGVVVSSVILAASSEGANSSPASNVTIGTAGTAITPTSAPSVTGIGTPVTFEVLPALPAGLTLDPNTGIISGTPVAALSATTFIVSAVGPNGVSIIPSTISFSSDGASMTPTQQTVTSQQGVAMTQTSAFTTSGLGSSVIYSIAPALPEGLTFSSSTGRISGTPTSASATQQYVISAVGTTGTATASISITVTGLTPGSQSIQATVGSAINPTTTLVGVGFSGVMSYSVSPALPQGLILNQSTGVISGTPTSAQSSASYTITGTDPNSNTGSATVSIQIAGITPSLQSIQATAGSAITATTAYTATGFTGAVSYSISPSLPNGLSMNSSGVISGTPTGAQSNVTYTVTAHGLTAGEATAVVSIRIAGLNPASQSVQGTAGVPISRSATYSPTGFNGTVSYSIAPAVSPGLTFDSSSGVISGTPASGQSPTDYTVTAQGSNSGIATAIISLQVAAISPTSTTVSATYGTAITPTAGFTATGFSGAVTYAVLPLLPAGLTLDTTTGVISGTPTVSSTQRTYTVTASGSTAGSANATVRVEVDAIAPSSPTSISASSIRGQANVSWTAGDDGGAPVTYTVTASPGGATCVTTGTSCVVAGLTPGVTYSFTVSANNGTGASSPASSQPVQVTAAVTPNSAPSATVGTTLQVQTQNGAPATTLEQGKTYNVSGTGFAPSSAVTIVMYSTPVTLGSVLANGQGAFETTITIPSSLSAGSHTLVALGVNATGSAEANAVLSVRVGVSPDLAHTGARYQWPAGLVILLLGVGFILVVVKRQQEA